MTKKTLVGELRGEGELDANSQSQMERGPCQGHVTFTDW